MSSKNSEPVVSIQVLTFWFVVVIVVNDVVAVDRLRKCCSTNEAFDVETKTCVDAGSEAGSLSLFPELMLHLTASETRVSTLIYHCRRPGQANANANANAK